MLYCNYQNQLKHMLCLGRWPLQILLICHHDHGCQLYDFSSRIWFFQHPYNSSTILFSFPATYEIFFRNSQSCLGVVTSFQLFISGLKNSAAICSDIIHGIYNECFWLTSIISSEVFGLCYYIWELQIFTLAQAKTG